MLLGELFRNLYIDGYILIAVGIPVDILDALSTQPEGRAGLCAFCDGISNLSVNGWHGDFSAQDSLCIRNWNLTVDVIASSIEEIVLPYGDGNIQVAGGTAV